MVNLSKNIRTRVPMGVIYPIALVVIFGIAFSLRVFLPYDDVFVGDWVRFGGNDPWYHMRLVENLVQHFPSRTAFDAYTLFPSGQNVLFAPFFDLLLGFFIWVIGLGNPTQNTIETVGAYFPAILGALVTIPVYFIGRELFNRNVGLLSAGLIAILPGEFLFRSLLGFTDHHIAEVLFSATAAMFLILAIKSAREKEASFSHIWNRDWNPWNPLAWVFAIFAYWKNLRKPLIYALLAGFVLGIYLLSWIGGVLFVFIVFVYMLIQYIIDHLRGKSTDYLCIIGVPMFLMVLIMVIPFLGLLRWGELVIVSLTIGLLALPVLSAVSRLMAYINIKRAYYPLALAGLALAGVGLFYLVEPSLLNTVWRKFGIFAPGVEALTIAEVQPLFSVSGFSVLWYYFTTDFFIALPALGLLIYAEFKEGSAEKTFLIIWCLIMLAAMLGQRRFAYYFAVNVALLSGYLSWRVLEWSWSYVREALEEREKRKRKAAKRKAAKRKVAKTEEMGRSITGYLNARYAWVALVAIIVFFAAFFPNIEAAMKVAEQSAGPNEDWHSALVWMRENTPDPFGDPNFYYEVYEQPSAGEGYDYPESAYGVMSWWDYGHWITRIAHRIPNANPFQKGIGGTRPDGTVIPGASIFLTAQDEASANEVLDDLGSKYVIIDIEMATPLWKFHVMPTWAGKDQDEFFEPYYLTTQEGLLPYQYLYHPGYYQSMCSRLYNFGGQAVVPVNSTFVISYKDVVDERGNKYKVITDAANEGPPFTTQEEAEAFFRDHPDYLVVIRESLVYPVFPFATYEEAEAFVDDHPDYIIVGTNPFVSPVPLEELEHYELLYKSDTVVAQRGAETISYVEIFEYLP